MTLPYDRDDDGGDGRRLGAATDYRAFRAARERYFARVRADTETRRLESAWRLASPSRGGPGQGLRPG